MKNYFCSLRTKIGSLPLIADAGIVVMIFMSEVTMRTTVSEYFESASSPRFSSRIGSWFAKSECLLKWIVVSIRLRGISAQTLISGGARPFRSPVTNGKPWNIWTAKCGNRLSRRLHRLSLRRPTRSVRHDRHERRAGHPLSKAREALRTEDTDMTTGLDQGTINGILGGDKWTPGRPGFQPVRARRRRKIDGPVPEWAGSNEEIQKLLETAFPRLRTDPRQKKRADRWALVIYYHYRVGWSQGDIAAHLGLPLHSVRAVIRRAKNVAAGKWANGEGLRGQRRRGRPPKEK
jgi:hypothetical protein